MSESLDDIAAKIKATDKPRRITVRKLLAVIGQERRGMHVSQQLRNKLIGRRLKCDPDFDDVHIDALVTLTLKPRRERDPSGSVSAAVTAEALSDDLANAQREPETPTATHPLVEAAESAAESEPPAVFLEPPCLVPERDVVVTIRKGIPAAGRRPVSVRRNEPARRALTTMIDQNIGELVVMSGERGQVEGIFSWQSYGRAVLANRPCETVGDCLSHDYGEVKESQPLFNAVREIIRHGIVAVRAKDGLLCGLVTQRDVAGVFVDLAEPFLFLGQIENRLRELVERMRLTREELCALPDQRDTARVARTTKVDDLSLGELIRGIQDPAYWAKLGLYHDHSIILQRFDRVREIRNRVMHFDADGITSADKTFLTETRRILQEL